ncbi:MAG: WXG100 family type VII secretion target [Kineosporiaceae bacterium]
MAGGTDGGQFMARSAGIQSHIEALKVEKGKLVTEQGDMVTADKQLITQWESDTQREFQVLQDKFSQAFTDFNTAFEKFIATTGTNHEQVKATEGKLAASVS